MACQFNCTDYYGRCPASSFNCYYSNNPTETTWHPDSNAIDGISIGGIIAISIVSVVIVLVSTFLIYRCAQRMKRREVARMVQFQNRASMLMMPHVGSYPIYHVNGGQWWVVDGRLYGSPQPVPNLPGCTTYANIPPADHHS